MMYLNDDETGVKNSSWITRENYTEFNTVYDQCHYHLSDNGID